LTQRHPGTGGRLPGFVKPLHSQTEIKTMTMTITSTFTTTQRADIEALRNDLSQCINQAVTADYGTDEGQHCAVLCVESLPLGSSGYPGPLVSILAGAGVAGDAAVVGSDGSAVGTAGDFADAIETARDAGMLAYGAMAVGAMH